MEKHVAWQPYLSKILEEQLDLSVYSSTTLWEVHMSNWRKEEVHYGNSKAYERINVFLYYKKNKRKKQACSNRASRKQSTLLQINNPKMAEPKTSYHQ